MSSFWSHFLDVNSCSNAHHQLTTQLPLSLLRHRSGRLALSAALRAHARAAAPSACRLQPHAQAQLLEALQYALDAANTDADFHVAALLLHGVRPFQTAEGPEQCGHSNGILETIRDHPLFLGMYFWETYFLVSLTQDPGNTTQVYRGGAP